MQAARGPRGAAEDCIRHGLALKGLRVRAHARQVEEAAGDVAERTGQRPRRRPAPRRGFEPAAVEGHRSLELDQAAHPVRMQACEHRGQRTAERMAGEKRSRDTGFSLHRVKGNANRAIGIVLEAHRLIARLRPVPLQQIDLQAA
jgi:hypothetical protein